MEMNTITFINNTRKHPKPQPIITNILKIKMHGISNIRKMTDMIRAADNSRILRILAEINNGKEEIWVI